MTSLRRAWLLASAVMVWQGCSLNDSGLTSDGGPPNDGGTGGLRTDGPVAGTGGSAAGGRGGAGGNASGVAGSVAGASGSAGGNVAGAGGSAGSSVAGAGGSVAGAGGSVAGAGGLAAGAAGSVAGAAGSVAGVGGSVGGARAGAGGNVAGAGGQGMAGTGGTVGGAGGISGMGGSVAGMGGRGGAGMSGRGGSGGGGRGGAGGRACAGFPTNARSFVPPTDNRVHCYWPHANMQTFSQARQTCSNEDGHLVTILSEEENLFVVSIAQFSPMYSDTWIGATDGRQGSDERGPGTYTWVTGETWNFDAWGTGEPDGSCDPCSGLQQCTCDHRGTLVSDGTWSDRWEGTARGFVCEATP